MSDLGESCSDCNSTVAGIVIDRVAKKTSCSECGSDFGLGDCGLSVVTTGPKNSSADEIFSPNLGKSQHGGSDPVSVSVAGIKRKFDDHGNSQNLGSVSDPVSIAAMSDRLGLVATIKDQANEIYKNVENTSKEKDKNASRAASIYIACRLEDMTHSMKEISSVANGVAISNISYAIELIAEKMKFKKNWFMDIKAADFINRFCSKLQMDGQAVKAAQDAAESSTCVNRGNSPISVAAVLVYVIAQLSPEKKLLEDVLEATGVPRYTMCKTYKVLYPHLPTIIPKWLAEEDDLKALVRSLTTTIH